MSPVVDTVRGLVDVVVEPGCNIAPRRAVCTAEEVGLNHPAQVELSAANRVPAPYYEDLSDQGSV